ncbi:MAG: MBL fold metallo-hydrolase [Phototrophicaceae bacterium]|jgi:glyoxylase-like metal-dependent hydrolase (beta-lactamase superfamily II)
MLQVGDATIHLINDATIWVDAGGAFGLVPRALYSAKFMPPNPENCIPMTLTCLLIQTQGKLIVVDTGYGMKDVGLLRRTVQLDRTHGDLLTGLARVGVQPETIDLVINTHLHYDHAGGNTFVDDDGTIYPTFPNAEYVVQRREYEDAMQPNERTRATYLPINYAPLVKSGQMRLLDGDSDLLTGVRAVVTPGHTPAHMSVIVDGGDAPPLMFVCDLASYAVHFERLGWMTAYDVEPLITLETKRQWREWALQTGATLVFPHDPKRHVARLGADGLEDIPEGFV